MSRSITGFHHVETSVSNLERSVAFYKELFGFKEEKRFVREDLRGKAAMLKLGEMRLEIWEFEDRITPKDDPADLKIRGLWHIAFSVEDIDKVYDELKTKATISELTDRCERREVLFSKRPGWDSD